MPIVELLRISHWDIIVVDVYPNLVTWPHFLWCHVKKLHVVWSWDFIRNCIIDENIVGGFMWQERQLSKYLFSRENSFFIKSVWSFDFARFLLHCLSSSSWISIQSIVILIFSFILCSLMPNKKKQPLDKIKTKMLFSTKVEWENNGAKLLLEYKKIILFLYELVYYPWCQDVHLSTSLFLFSLLSLNISYHLSSILGIIAITRMAQNG